MIRLAMEQCQGMFIGRFSRTLRRGILLSRCESGR
jgi:hypothetical protein